jgi:hypothetical protein
MRHQLFVAGVLLAIATVGSGTIRAQMRNSQAAPSPGSRTPSFRSVMTFDPRTPVTRPSTALPSRAVRPLPVLPLWWRWDPAFAFDEQVLRTPPLAGGAPTGGVQLDYTPWSAEVYVDGVRAGRVEEFRGYYRHLAATAGPHVISIVSSGYEPIYLDVVVWPGRTVTYRGTLLR